MCSITGSKDLAIGAAAPAGTILGANSVVGNLGTSGARRVAGGKSRSTYLGSSGGATASGTSGVSGGGGGNWRDRPGPTMEN